MRKILLLLTIGVSGCGTMNSNFSCNVTAGDSCLTIEEVDAMTRFADDAYIKVKPKQGINTKRPCRTNHEGIWFTK